MEAEKISGLIYDGSRCPLCGDAFEDGDEYNEVVALVRFPVKRMGDAVRVKTHTHCRNFEAVH